MATDRRGVLPRAKETGFLVEAAASLAFVAADWSASAADAGAASVASAHSQIFVPFAISVRKLACGGSVLPPRSPPVFSLTDTPALQSGLTARSGRAICWVQL